MLRFEQNQTTHINIANLRIALLTHILSKQLDENLIIRITNSDQDKHILETLNLFSIDYTQVIHRSDHIKYHTQMAMQLLLNKKAFNCFCSDEALQKDKQEAIKHNKPYSYSGFCENLSDEVTLNLEAPFTVRVKKPTQDIKLLDKIQGQYTFTPDECDSFIILHHDKTPTNDFACAIDDMLNDISAVVSEKSQTLNSARQAYIRNLLGYDKQLSYTHIPTISNIQDIPDVNSLIEDGFLPVAIANYLVSLGYDTPKEIFTIEEAIQWLDITNISNTPIIFDIDKLKDINKQHIYLLDDMRLSKILGFADNDIGALAKIYLDRCSTIKQLKEKISNIFTTKTNLENFEEEFNKLKKCLQNAPFIDDINDLQAYITKETQLSGKSLTIPLRFILTNSTQKIDLDKIYPLIKNYLEEIIK